MDQEHTAVLQEVASLLNSGDKQQLRLLLNELHAADLAEWLTSMEKPERMSCFRLLDLDNASAVLAELEPESQRELLQELGDLGIVPLISRMSPDDAVDLLGDLPEDKARSIISQMTDPEAVEDIQELMSFKEDSAGGIMSTDYLAVSATMTTAQALSHLRESYAEFDEDVYDVYVLGDQDQLVGVVTLKELLTAPPEAPVATLMDTDVIKVTTGTDQEQAAEKLSRYDLLSLPVVDAEGRIRGIITADDAIDVIEEEATEDIYQSSGIDVSGPEETEEITYNVPLSFRARLPWLVITLLIETISASVIIRFDDVIRQTIAAASFMPLLSGVTGSVATQSTCIIIRGTATGHINWRAAGKNLKHEFKVGMLLGIACGITIWLVSSFLHMDNQRLAIVVAVSLFLTMMVGVMIGTLMPMIFHRLGIDPAHASGPFITSILDVSTVTIYLTIVHTVLSQLV